jgi:mannose-1-phosphate guanylyltransferase
VVIGANTTVGDNVLISPYTTIGSNCDIADDTSVLSGIIYNDVKIGAHTSVSGSVVDNGTRIGDHCVLENNTVIGPRVLVYDFVTVHSGVSIWPDVVIDGGDVYKDVLNPAYDTHKDGS